MARTTYRVRLPSGNRLELQCAAAAEIYATRAGTTVTARTEADR